MRTPKNQGWTDKYYNLNFKATSDYSIKTVGIADYQIQTMTIYIRGIYLPGFELVGTMVISALAAAALAGRGARDGEGEAIDENGNVVPLESPSLNDLLRVQSGDCFITGPSSWGDQHV